MKTLIDVYIHRDSGDDQGTDGILSIPALGFSCYSIELPWRDNQRDISCIPPGTYDLVWTEGRYKGFKLLDVPDRDDVEIHKGNWAGDTSKGFMSNSEGCIHLGKSRGELAGQKAVKFSSAATMAFNLLLKDKQARITIVGPPEAANG